MTYRGEIYETVMEQLEGILVNNTDPITAMVTINSLLKYNFENFYWVGLVRFAACRRCFCCDWGAFYDLLFFFFNFKYCFFFIGAIVPF